MTSALQILLMFISETVQLAVVAGLSGFGVGLIPSLFAYISLRTNRQAAQEVLVAQMAASTAKIAEFAAEQSLIKAKADHIINQGDRSHELTNGNLSRVTSKLDVANETISGMAQLIKSMTSDKSVADNLAVRKEINGGKLSTAPPPVPVVDNQVADLLKGEVTEKLDSIKEDTK